MCTFMARQSIDNYVTQHQSFVFAGVRRQKIFFNRTKSELKMGFGKELFRLRKQQRLSQDALAMDIGVNKKNVSRWENEEVLPNVEMGAKVAVALGVSLDAMLGEDAQQKDAELARLMQRVVELPQSDRDVLKRVAQGLLAVN